MPCPALIPQRPRPRRRPRRPQARPERSGTAAAGPAATGWRGGWRGGWVLCGLAAWATAAVAAGPLPTPGAASAVAAPAGSPPPAVPPSVPPSVLEGWVHVADVLAALRARDGQGTIVTHDGAGWTIVNEPLASAQWTFTPPGHEAWPAVVRRTLVRGADRQVQVHTHSLCEAPPEACERLLQRFGALDERIRQAVRGRQAPPAPAGEPAPAVSPPR